MNTDYTLTRRYDIDWIRIMLILSVFLFHIGMFFNSFGWHIKNNEKVLWLDPIMAYLHTWRMPLLFLVSGVGTYFALGKRKIYGFIKERSHKLLIPLIFGMFVIVPPQVFVEKHEQYGSFINFIPHITEGSYPTGNFSWHHLWFILYLLICAMASIPFIMLLRSKTGKSVYKLLEKISSNYGLYLLIAIPLFAIKKIMLNYFPEETHALVNDWAYITYSFLFFMNGYILISKPKLIDNITRQRRIFGITTIVLTALFFYDFYNSLDTYINNNIQLFLKCLFEWSIALSIIGYASAYLNRDNRWRKHLNEAIYPFYILHQTIIILIAFLIVDLSISTFAKAAILIIGSFSACVLIYLLIIRPFNIMRILFGMHKKQKVKNAEKEILKYKVAS